MKTELAIDAEEWLRKTLEYHAPVEVSEIREAAKLEGFSRKEILEAKKALGVVTTSNWSKETGVSTEWYWSLP